MMEGGGFIEVDEMVVNIYYYYYIILAEILELQCKITHSGVGCVSDGSGCRHRRDVPCLVFVTTYKGASHPPIEAYRTPHHHHWTAVVRIIGARCVGGDIKGRK